MVSMEVGTIDVVKDWETGAEETGYVRFSLASSKRQNDNTNRYTDWNERDLHQMETTAFLWNIVFLFRSKTIVLLDPAMIPNNVWQTVLTAFKTLWMGKL